MSGICVTKELGRRRERQIFRAARRLVNAYRRGARGRFRRSSYGTAKCCRSARTRAPTCALKIMGPGAITRLIRRPGLGRIIDLMAEGAIRIEGGTLLDLAARRGTCQDAGAFSGSARSTLAALAMALPGPARRAKSVGARHDYTDAVGEDGRHGTGRQAARAVPLRPVERVLRALPRARHGLLLRLLHRLERRRSTRRSATSSR